MLDVSDTPSDTPDQPATEDQGEAPDPSEPPHREAATDPADPGDPAGPADQPAPRRAATRKTAAKRTPAKRTTKKSVASAGAEPAADDQGPAAADDAPTAPRRAPARRTRKAPAAATVEAAGEGVEPGQEGTGQDESPEAPPAAKRAAAKRTTARRTTKKAPPPADLPVEPTTLAAEPGAAATDTRGEESGDQPGPDQPAAPPVVLVTPLFQPPAQAPAPAAEAEPGPEPDAAEDLDDTEPGDAAREAAADAESPTEAPTEATAEGAEPAQPVEVDGEAPGEGGPRRRRRRGGRRRRRGGEGGEGGEPEDTGPDGEVAAGEDDRAGSDGEPAAAGGPLEAERAEPAEGAEAEEKGGTTRRRRRRRRAGETDDGGPDDPQNTVTRVRQTRRPEDEITGFTGSTRLEAKKQRRREGREAGRRRAPVISEAEFLARRESVDRVMVIRERDDLTQIAVLEDKVLVEHYVARESQTSLIGNVYLGRVQNVLPSMEAAFIDIGKGRNAVLYAGEVNWEALGANNGGSRRIEAVLKPGQAVLVQVSKDPVGHKGARLTSQVSLPGRFLVLVPDGTASGISRKLPDTERNRLKALLKEIVPDTAGVIVRTAAEGASEQELTHDVERLTARWADIEAKVAAGNAPQLVYGEPDLTLKVVRDLFTEDFSELVVSGAQAWETVSQYVELVAPDLAGRLRRHEDADGGDAFAAYRIDEQIAKGLDRKVWLPSGGSLVIDRTEAMTVIDVNTGKFTGSGGNLEETVTKNNLEAAEEIVRQLRLRDVGGIIVVDFIDMVLESNRELVLRRLVECLGRDRTRHQVAEVTSLGLVQMTRKRIGTGLLEAFSEPCEACQGRGVVVHQHPVEPKRRVEDDRPGRRGRGRGGRGRSEEPAVAAAVRVPTPADLAAMARHDDRPDPEPAEPEQDRPAAGGAGEDTADQPAAVGNPDQAPGDRPEPATDHAASPPAGPGEPPADDPTAGRLLEQEAGPVDEREAGQEAVQEAGQDAGRDVAAPVTPPEPAVPRIVTTTRRRGATRAAGPPAGTPDHEPAGAEPPQPAPADPPGGQPLDGEPLEAGVDGEPELVDASWAHVPVKKKGSRKR